MYLNVITLTFQIKLLKIQSDIPKQHNNVKMQTYSHLSAHLCVSPIKRKET